MAILRASSGVSVHSRIFLAQYILSNPPKREINSELTKTIKVLRTLESRAFCQFLLVEFEKRSRDRRESCPLPTVAH
jgi:hypothetical protein